MSSSNIFLIHGAYGNPNENWFPSISKYATAKELEVFAPSFPTPEQQSLENWNSTFDSFRSNINQHSILIGHSIGVAFCLRLLESLSNKIFASFFISGFASQLGLEEFDALNSTFLGEPFNWRKIRANCAQFSVLHGSNDPYVATSYADELSKQLDCKKLIIENGGHLNEDAGFTEFPLLLKSIEETLSS